jgi:cell division protein FtsQ
VRRVWPDRLEISVEEHVALARWGDDAMVNTYGERFSAKFGTRAGADDPELPVFIAPAGTEAEVARRYARFAKVAAPLGAALQRVVLTPRYAWQLRLENGLQLMLGRDAELAEARLQRFVEVYPRTVGAVSGRHDYVDLRYPNGFALRVPQWKG